MSYNKSNANSIYMFRCNDGGLFALTGDRTGQILPSHIYPRITWRLVRCVKLKRYQTQEKKKMFTAILEAIKKSGFYLIHAGDKVADGLFERIERSRQPKRTSARDRRDIQTFTYETDLLQTSGMGTAATS